MVGRRRSAGDAAKIGALTVERERHPAGLERRNEVEIGFDLKARQRQRDESHARVAAERRKRVRNAAQSDSEPAIEGATDVVLWVQQALGKLDPSEREIVMLREYEQLSYLDIAELLRIPVNTVRSRLFRARLALKGWLESEKTRDRSVIANGAGNGAAVDRAGHDEA